jgi:telomerase reverse transcriptase
MKRKRNSISGNLSRPEKKHSQPQPHDQSQNPVQHAVLSNYYDKLVSLRDYLLDVLLNEEKTRETAKVIKSFAKLPNDTQFHQFLQHTLVAYNPTDRKPNHPKRQNAIAVFSQALSPSIASTIGQNVDPTDNLLQEVLNFVIWNFFRSSPKSRPGHLLCQGFERASAKTNLSCGIPGVICAYPNSHIESLIGPNWCSLLALLGQGGDVIIATLLLDCSIFSPTSHQSASNRNYFQLSGIPLCNLAPVIKTLQPASKPLSEIRLVRNRMFYCRPTFNSKGNVRLGLRHVHVFNRFKNLDSKEEDLHISKYIFPRQFNLHNVFTSSVDTRETTHSLKDYTLRESEITKFPIKKLPKRLRGNVQDLVRGMRKAHANISYVELLQFYCPLPARGDGPADNQIENATCEASVVAFAKAVLIKFVKKSNWGQGPDGDHNSDVINQAVTDMILRRKFETLTLHEIVNQLKISSIPWLQPPNCCASSMSRSDFEKRKELAAEFVYYLFDSYLVPLIRSNFHVTESNKDKNRLFYFRLDVWQNITQPAMQKLKKTMFKEVQTDKVKRVLALRKFGYSNVRLVPKSDTFRPIMNLRRRPEYILNGKRCLGSSINSVLTPLYKSLLYESSRSPSPLGSAILSVSGLYDAVKSYKSRLLSIHNKLPPLYFAKVDVLACFDTLPQDTSLAIAASLLTSNKYAVTKHALVSPPIKILRGSRSSLLRHRIRYKTNGHSTRLLCKAADDGAEALDEQGRRNGVYIGLLGQNTHRTKDLVEMLGEHVQRNVVKIGRRFYIQKKGVPQGGVVSALLCSLVYAELEKNKLGFINQDQGSMLVRMVDDFLCISTDEKVVEKFIKTMHRGMPEYGVVVKGEKTVANFDFVQDGTKLQRCHGSLFPYCGVYVETNSLNVVKDTSKMDRRSIVDSLTVEKTSLPGQAFRQKVLYGLTMHLHSMYFDTSHNSISTALVNVYRTFYHAALRMMHYMHSLGQRPSTDLISSKFFDGDSGDYIKRRVLNLAAQQELSKT